MQYSYNVESVSTNNASAKDSLNRLFINLGTALEYYDFIIFAYLSPYLVEIFFTDIINNNGDQYAIFKKIFLNIMFISSSSIIRLIAGCVVGFYALNKNRYFTFIFSIYSITISSLLIAFLPVFNQYLYISIIMLIILRFIQIMSYAIEMPSALFALYNGADNKDKFVFYIAFLIACTTIGALSANFISFLMKKYLSHNEIIDFGWRIAFFIGAFVGLIILIHRRSMIKNISNNVVNSVNSNDFYKDSLLFEYIKSHKKQIVTFVLMQLIPAIMIIAYIRFPYILPKYSNYSSSEILFNANIGLVFSIISSFISAYIIYYKRDMVKYHYISFILYLIFNIFYFTRSIDFLVINLCIYQYYLTFFMIFSLLKFYDIFSINENIKSLMLIIIYNFTFTAASFIVITLENI